MSCAWDLYCRSCEESHGFDLNHGNVTLVRLWKQRALIVPLAELNVGYSDIKLYLNYNSNPIFPGWFAKHQGHDVVARNEYGEFDEQCNERVKCPSCKDEGICRQEKGHVGEHTYSKRYP